MYDGSFALVRALSEIAGPGALSPDGSRYYVAQGQGLVVVDVATGRFIEHIPLPSEAPMPLMDPAGRYVVLVTLAATVFIDLR